MSISSRFCALHNCMPQCIDIIGWVTERTSGP